MHVFSVVSVCRVGLIDILVVVHSFCFVDTCRQRSRFNRATFYTETEAVVYEIYQSMRNIHGIKSVPDCNICPC